MIKEKNLFEVVFDCELEASISDSKGVFYFDNGHSFDKVLFYGNESTLFGFEFLLFLFILYLSGNYLIAILSIGIVFKVIADLVPYFIFNGFLTCFLIQDYFNCHYTPCEEQFGTQNDDRQTVSDLMLKFLFHFDF